MKPDYGSDAPGAIHNRYQAKERRQAVAEIARVMKPGACALIDDIRHGGEYADEFASHGCTAERVGSTIGSLTASVMTMGSLRPVELVVRKAATP
jgi:hypothetical protein